MTSHDLGTLRGNKHLGMPYRCFSCLLIVCCGHWPWQLQVFGSECQVHDRQQYIGQTLHHVMTTLQPRFEKPLLYPAWSRCERILDVVPGGAELEPRVKSGSLAGCSHS